MSEQTDERAVSGALDLDGSNPFWPKNMGTSGPDTPASNAIDIDDIGFGADTANVTVNVTTTPPGQAWTVKWGDTSADEPIAAGTNSATHTYADVSSGTVYKVEVTAGTDTDARTVGY